MRVDRRGYRSEPDPKSIGELMGQQWVFPQRFFPEAVRVRSVGQDGRTRELDVVVVERDSAKRVGGASMASGTRIPTRERILDAAWELFVRQGFAGTTVAQIEADASLAAGSGSLYRHFSSKEDVLRAVVDRAVERVDAARELGPEPMETGGDVRVALAIEFQRRLDNLRRLHPLIDLVRREREHLGPSHQHLGDLLVERNLSVRSQRLAAWMDAGDIPRRDPAALATTVMSTLTGYHLAVEFFGGSPGGLREQELISTLVDLVTGQ